jgi:hypothetical protein
MNAYFRLMTKIRVLCALLVSGTLWLTTAGVAQASTMMVPAAACIPSNNLFIGPLSGPLNSITGGFGGVLKPFVLLVVAIAAVAAVVSVLTNKAERWMKAIGYVLAIALGIPLVLALFSGVYNLVSNAC